MSGRKVLVLGLVAVMLGVFGGQALGEGVLSDLVEQEGLGWLAGRWTATTDEGQEIQIVYRWAVDKQAVIVDLKIGEHSSHGMIFYCPKKGEVVDVSVDSRGSASMGTWDVKDGKAISKSEVVGADGETYNYMVTREKINRSTMKVALYPIMDGVVGDEAWAVMEFKRQPRQPRAKGAAARGRAKKTKAE